MIKLTQTETDRFWSKVDKTESCWIWTASTRSGYGAFKLRGGVFQAHRLVWLLENEPPKFGEEVCHKCNNKLCVNPAHLYVGTRSDNMRDSLKAGTWAYNNRKLTPEAVKQIRDLNSQGVGHRRLSRAFGVGRSTIKQIVDRKTWTDID